MSMLKVTGLSAWWQQLHAWLYDRPVVQPRAIWGSTPPAPVYARKARKVGESTIPLPALWLRERHAEFVPGTAPGHLRPDPDVFLYYATPEDQLGLECRTQPLVRVSGKSVAGA